MVAQTSPPGWSKITELILEASSALALLNGDRLEELATSCRDSDWTELRRKQMPEEIKGVVRRELFTLQEILKASESNLSILRTLHGSSMKIEYAPNGRMKGQRGVSAHGND